MDAIFQNNRIYYNNDENDFDAMFMDNGDTADSNALTLRRAVPSTTNTRASGGAAHARQTHTQSQFDAFDPIETNESPQRRVALHSAPPLRAAERKRANVIAEAAAAATGSGSSNQPARVTDERVRAAGAQMCRQMGAQFASVFPHPLNAMQQRCFQETFYTDHNMLVSAPTGCGKTTVMEIAIVRWLQPGAQSAASGGTRGKVIYVAPIKALCQQRLTEWRAKFATLGVAVAELTGDTGADVAEQRAARKADLVVTTPEKWDAVTRKRKDGHLLSNVDLLLLDEVHLVGDKRGPSLEACVSRVRAAAKRQAANVRIIALSATIPNVADVARWLHVPDSGVLQFGEEYRPVRIEHVVRGYEPARSTFLFDLSLNYKLLDLALTHGRRRPVLIFCATRNGAVKGAQTMVKQLRDNASLSLVSGASHTRLRQAASTCNNAALKDCLVWGVAFHSAALSTSDRRLVEELFIERHLPLLCTTRTLAMGVNLPSFCVIIKGTSYWSDEDQGMVEYSASDVLQMTGRAGRPQFDKDAVAVIMTERANVAKWQSLMLGQLPLESHMHEQLTGFVNAEIAAMTLLDVDEVLLWLKSTYLFCRLTVNPTHYNLPAGLSSQKLEQRLQEMVLHRLNELKSAELIVLGNDGKSVRSTKSGNLMAKYYIQFETMVIFNEMSGDANIYDVLCTLVSCAEFSDSVLRRSEKKTLNELNKSVRFKLTHKVKTAQHKLVVLLQAALGTLRVDDWSLKQELQRVMRTLLRVSRCLIDHLELRKCFDALCAAIQLATCLKRRMWEDSSQTVRQLPSIGEVMSTSLLAAGLGTLEKVRHADPSRIEAVVNRRPPFGISVINAANAVPNYRLEVRVDKQPGMHDNDLLVTARLLNFESVESSEFTSYSMLVVGNDRNELLLSRRFKDASTAVLEQRVRVPSSTLSMTVRLLSLDWCGIEQSRFVSMRSDVLDATEAPSLLSTMEKKDAAAAVGGGGGGGGGAREDASNKSGTASGANGAYEMVACNHNCADKQLCKHQCCKRGVRRKRKRNDDKKVDTESVGGNGVNGATGGAAPNGGYGVQSQQQQQQQQAYNVQQLPKYAYTAPAAQPATSAYTAYAAYSAPNGAHGGQAPPNMAYGVPNRNPTYGDNSAPPSTYGVNPAYANAMPYNNGYNQAHQAAPPARAPTQTRAQPPPPMPMPMPTPLPSSTKVGDIRRLPVHVRNSGSKARLMSNISGEHNAAQAAYGHAHSSDDTVRNYFGPPPAKRPYAPPVNQEQQRPQQQEQKQQQSYGVHSSSWTQPAPPQPTPQTKPNATQIWLSTPVRGVDNTMASSYTHRASNGANATATRTHAWHPHSLSPTPTPTPMPMPAAATQHTPSSPLLDTRASHSVKRASNSVQPMRIYEDEMDDEWFKFDESDLPF